MGWLVASAGTLLAVSAGLMLFARYEAGQAGLATVLLSLYVASWAYAGAILALAFFAVWWLMGVWRHRKIRAAMRRHAAAESLSLRIDDRHVRSSARAA
jgi:hypothetical protein